MEKIIEWLINTFREKPLSLLFFLLGTLLILLGLLEPPPSSPIGFLVLQANFRWIALLLGLGFILLSIVFYYRPQKKTEDGSLIVTELVDRGIEEAVRHIDLKIKTLNNLGKNCPFCLVGAVYLDVMVSPVDTTVLTKDEWSSMEEIKYDIGGSTIWVGRFLMNKGQQSHLFSVIGDENEQHTKRFRDIFLENNDWVLNDDFLQKAQTDQAKIGTTVHLIQRDQRFGTMFTYRGVLREFGWSRIETQLKSRLQSGGVLYLAGYLKTNLCDGLARILGELADKTLICMDHGRLVEESGFGPAIKTLRAIFREGLVDVYFCTYQEIFDLFKVEHRNSPPLSWRQVNNILADLVQKESLPLITMVRGGYIDEEMRVFMIVGKKIIPLEGSLGPTYIRRTVGASNAFNASAIYHLVKEQHNKLEDRVKNAARIAFQELEEWTQKPVNSRGKQL